MRRTETLRYVISTFSGEEVKAFIPSPLPPAPPLKMARELQRLHDRALLACGRLDAITSLLPDPDLFLYAYVRREAVLSSQIEGTQSSISDLLVFELHESPGVPHFSDVMEVSNYVSALEHGLRRLDEGFPLSNRLIREVHALLLASGRGAEAAPGEFRRSQNWIGGTRPGNARFVPPPPGEVESCMADLERFLHDDRDCATLVKTALAHVQFETIHPFLDGNGRVGRLLVALILKNEGILRQPLLYLSLYFKQHRGEYYRLLDAARFEGDWEAWLVFFLEGVVQTASGAVLTAQRLIELFQNDARRAQDAGGNSANILRTFDALRLRPVVTIKDLGARAKISIPTAAAALNVLVRAGIMREITGRKRDRIFVYDAYLAILNEGAEPL